ncbi:uncharacterized protein RBU47_000423 isoform 2-T2 [Passerculus sandwichensis]
MLSDIPWQGLDGKCPLRYRHECHRDAYREGRGAAAPLLPRPRVHDLPQHRRGKGLSVPPATAAPPAPSERFQRSLPARPHAPRRRRPPRSPGPGSGRLCAARGAAQSPCAAAPPEPSRSEPLSLLRPGAVPAPAAAPGRQRLSCPRPAPE